MGEPKVVHDYFLLDIEDEVAILSFNRPEFLNALCTNLVKEFQNILKELATNKSVNVVILTGTGDRAFVAGADIREIREMNSTKANAYSALGQNCLSFLEKMEKIVIAAVNGFALGGGAEIALACDFIVASEKAQFGLPEVTLGVMPGFGGTQRLPRAIGSRLAKELVYSGERIGARRAMEIGLVNRVYPHHMLLVETKELAKKISANSFSAILACKQAINESIGVEIDQGYELERKLFSLTFDKKDAQEGISAFLEKRVPKFK